MPLALHVIGYDLRKLAENGCQLATPEPIFAALMVETRAEPCLTGCVYYDGGKCPAFQKYHTVALDERERKAAEQLRNSSDQSGLIGGKWAGMTSSQIRQAEGGISPGEFQKRKQAGRYKE